MCHVLLKFTVLHTQTGRELAVLDSLKSNSYLKEVEDIIEEVYKSYHYSPNKRVGTEENVSSNRRGIVNVWVQKTDRFKKTLSKLHDFYSRSEVFTKVLEQIQKLLSESLQASAKVPDP